MARSQQQASSLMAIVLALMLAGCGGTPRQTMTGAEAAERLDGHLTSAVGAAPAPLRVTRAKDDFDESGCSGSAFYDDFTGQVKAVVSYQTSEVSSEAAEKYLETLAGLWEREWGQVDRSTGHVGVRIEDGEVALYGNYLPGIRRVRVSGVSGCVWVGGTPGPDDNP